MATDRSSLEKTRKMSLKLVLNNTSPQAHMESELDVLGVPRKLVRYASHSSKKKKLKKNLFSFTQAIQTAID
jgi:hypothetical protein